VVCLLDLAAAATASSTSWSAFIALTHAAECRGSAVAAAIALDASAAVRAINGARIRLGGGPARFVHFESAVSDLHCIRRAPVQPAGLGSGNGNGTGNCHTPFA